MRSSIVSTLREMTLADLLAAPVLATVPPLGAPVTGATLPTLAAQSAAGGHETLTTGA